MVGKFAPAWDNATTGGVPAADLAVLVMCAERRKRRSMVRAHDTHFTSYKAPQGGSQLAREVERLLTTDEP
jgi:hypothetical protein